MVKVNQAQFAEICGVTRQTVLNWQGEGMSGVSKPTRNSVYIDVVAAMKWIREHKQTDDKDRLARIRADDAQLDLDAKLHSLMNVAEAKKAWETACASMRAHILAIAPLAQQRLGLTVPQTQEVTSLLLEALEPLSGRMDAPPEDDDEEEPEQKPLPAGQKRRGIKRNR